MTGATSEAGAVLIGILCGLVALLLSIAVMALTDRELTIRVLRRMRAGRHGVLRSAP